jgi:beta-aspartyl-peptidase (threonine type)
VHGITALAEGARAAVLAAVSFMEESTPLNAGRGAVLDANGNVSLDAGFMDGTTRRFGGVGGVRRHVNAARIAASLTDDGDFGRFLIGDAADEAGNAAGLAAVEPKDLVTDRARERAADSTAPRGDTVGAVAVDARGHLAAAVSTGGLVGKRAGRVGDSAIVGAGFWADDSVGAAATTGIGEALLRQGTARRAVQLIAEGLDAREAAREVLAELASEGRECVGIAGIIVIDAQGGVGIAHDSAAMAAGWIHPDGQPQVRMQWH